MGEKADKEWSNRIIAPSTSVLGGDLDRGTVAARRVLTKVRERNMCYLVVRTIHEI
jgi:hypothetical protein